MHIPMVNPRQGPSTCPIIQGRKPRAPRPCFGGLGALSALPETRVEGRAPPKRTRPTSALVGRVERLRETSQCANSVSPSPASDYRPESAARRGETGRKYGKTRRIPQVGPRGPRPLDSPPAHPAIQDVATKPDEDRLRHPQGPIRAATV